jgi:4'-phosphopantetheinyl transferase
VDRGPRQRSIHQEFRQHLAQLVIPSLTWPASTVRGTIAPDEVHLWAWTPLPATGDLSVYLEVLDRQELERMHRFHFASLRESYAVHHGNLRRILAAYLNRPPQAIGFRANRFGKPELAEETTLHFSLSHSRSVAVLAVAHGQPLGVDVEDVRPIEPDVAEAHFSARELSDLRQLQGDAWLRGFYRCWTSKEAILKAEGVGLHRALDSFDVALLPGQPPELRGTREPFSYPWKLHNLSPSPAAIGALATAQSRVNLVCLAVDG